MKKNKATIILFYLLILSNYLPVEASWIIKAETKTITVSNLPADPAISGTSKYTDRFTFFSFKTGKIVPNSDSLTSKWDIGFKGTNIIVNGGTNRKGKGGLRIQEESFDKITEVSKELTFAVDTEGNAALPTGSGNGWYTYSPSTHEITPIPNRTIIIKTADGHYAKMEIQSYYRNSDTSDETRYYTFRYNYQKNDSKLF
jgi:hypothetical protein